MLERLPTIKQLEFPTDPVLGPTTLNIGTIRGGTEANVVPESCEAEVMLRLVSDVAPVKAQLEEWARGWAELEFGSTIPAQKFHTLPGFRVEAVAYTSDIPLLTRWGKPLLFGPGSIHVAHTPEEYVDVNELRASVAAYQQMVRALLAA
jgi:acetylornithine deacetylase